VGGVKVRNEDGLEDGTAVIRGMASRDYRHSIIIIIIIEGWRT
jgi:hypothetical protein